MFRTYARRFVVPGAALLLSALLVLPAIGDTEPPASAPRTPPLLFAPPLFSTSGQSHEVTAVVTGSPDAVRLVVGDRSFEMRRSGDSTFAGTIPPGLATAELTYSVTAAFGNVVNTSEPAHLVVLDRIRGSSPKIVANGGHQLVKIGLGDEAGQLGVSSNRDGARQLPAAFVTDASGERLRILDTVKGRVVDATKDGVRASTKLANGSTTATDLVHGPRDSLLVLDQVRDEVVELTEHGQRGVGGVGARKHVRGSRLAFQESSDTVLVSDATQGRFVPLLKGGRKATPNERAAQADGTPTSIGAIAAQVDGSSVLFGVDAAHNEGFRVTFADPVLDATDIVVDGAGVIWALVGTARDQDAVAYLVSLDPETGSSTAASVPVSTAGDVTRRLAAADDGVVLMTATEDALSFERFLKGDGR